MLFMLLLAGLRAPLASQALPRPEIEGGGEVEQLQYQRAVRREIEDVLREIASPSIGGIPGAVLSIYGDDAVYQGPGRRLEGQSELTAGFQHSIPAMFGANVAVVDVAASINLAGTVLTVFDDATGASVLEHVIWERRRGEWTIVYHHARATEVAPRSDEHVSGLTVAHNRGRHGYGNRFKIEGGAASLGYAPEFALARSVTGSLGMAVEIQRAVELHAAIFLQDGSAQGGHPMWNAGARLFLAPSARWRPFLSAGIERSNPVHPSDVGPSGGVGLSYDIRDWAVASLGAQHVFHLDPHMGPGDVWWDNRRAGSWRLQAGIQLGIRTGREGPMPPAPGADVRFRLPDPAALSAILRWADAIGREDGRQLRAIQSESASLILPDGSHAFGRNAATLAGMDWARTHPGVRLVTSSARGSGRLLMVSGDLIDPSGQETFRVTVVAQLEGGAWLVRQASIDEI